ncbi:hypothetical protein KY333_05180 [Candidatus Woesearchaeota archaeon]|nr:hypothetical protein [Candidatus Woesearchaeota archaeon]
MNRQARSDILKGILMGIATIGLFVSLFTFSMLRMGENYDSSGFDNDTIAKYDKLTELSTQLNETKGVVDQNVEKNAFDIIGGWFSNGLSAIKTFFRGLGFLGSSTSIMYDISSDSVDDLNLHPLFKTYITAIVIILIIIGIFLIKYIMNKD